MIHTISGYSTTDPYIILTAPEPTILLLSCPLYQVTTGYSLIVSHARSKLNSALYQVEHSYTKPWVRVAIIDDGFVAGLVPEAGKLFAPLYRFDVYGSRLVYRYQYYDNNHLDECDANNEDGPEGGKGLDLFSYLCVLSLKFRAVLPCFHYYGFPYGADTTSRPGWTIGSRRTLSKELTGVLTVLPLAYPLLCLLISKGNATWGWYLYLDIVHVIL